MITQENKNIENFVLTEFIVEDILNKIDSKQFEQFLKERNFKSSGSKTTKLYNLKLALDKLTKEEYLKELKLVEEFFFEQIKFTSNRIIISYPFEIGMNHPLHSKAKFENFAGKPLEILDYSNLFEESRSMQENFEKVHQKFSCIDNQINMIELYYIRKVRYSDSKKKCEFVWIEIDCVDREVRIHIENNQKNLSVDLQGKPASLFSYFSKELQKRFLVIPIPNPQQVTLFKMYRKLTSYAEKEYIERVAAQETEISSFISTIIDEEHLSMEDNLDLKSRLKWLLIRQLIQNDFENFLAIQQNGDGKVKSIIFHYEEGGTISANSGSSNKDIMEELNLEHQSAYFDTRESIYKTKKLFSITVNWNVKLGEEYSKKVLTKYQAYPLFLVTHFLKDNVSEGVYNDVFPRIREFEILPLLQKNEGL